MHIYEALTCQCLKHIFFLGITMSVSSVALPIRFWFSFFSLDLFKGDIDIMFCDYLEAWSGCEANRQAKACLKIHLDGEKHWHCTRPDDSRAWHHSSEPLLLLAEERCLGRAQGVT